MGTRHIENRTANAIFVGGKLIPPALVATLTKRCCRLSGAARLSRMAPNPNPRWPNWWPRCTGAA